MSQIMLIQNLPDQRLDDGLAADVQRLCCRVPHPSQHYREGWDTTRPSSIGTCFQKRALAPPTKIA
jgi:hypothetical protein